MHVNYHLRLHQQGIKFGEHTSNPSAKSTQHRSQIHLRPRCQLRIALSCHNYARKKIRRAMVRNIPYLEPSAHSATALIANGYDPNEKSSFSTGVLIDLQARVLLKVIQRTGVESKWCRIATGSRRQYSRTPCFESHKF